MLKKPRINKKYFNTISHNGSGKCAAQALFVEGNVAYIVLTYLQI